MPAGAHSRNYLPARQGAREGTCHVYANHVVPIGPPGPLFTPANDAGFDVADNEIME